VWVRYSNGVGWSQSDKDNDARGMAVKLMGVPGAKYDVDEQATQDFLMTNAPTPVGKNAEEFMAFAHANANGLFPSLLFLIGHPVTAAPALLRTGPIQSAVTEQYWSGGAYHLGAHQAIKYTAKPCDGSPSRSLLRDIPDYLRRDLEAAAKGGLCYTLYVQFQVDPVETPIEDASKEWTESTSPLVRVADITMPPQDTGSPEEAKLCDSLSFNPWHSIAAHKPMGHINRARRFVYGASRVYRHGGHEPTGFEGFDVPKPL
jgi:catalase